ncbi:MAG TPA: protein kinase [Polyangia bacterium]|nr:protein kinase [Polyangia bacterium]
MLAGGFDGATLKAFEQHIGHCAECCDLLSAAARAFRPAERRLGRYQLLSAIGGGATGIIYQARDADTGDLVALKTVRRISQPAMASLRREIHALARVRHPAIVRVFEHGMDGDRPWYAMELLAGETLADLCRRIGRRPTVAAGGELTRALTIIERLCAPLAFLHGEGIVHLDLKPLNILLREGDRPVLVDFGLVARVTGSPGREELDARDVDGTPRYMAPEQIRGDLLDPRADLYALGCVLYELVTGRPPFDAEDAEDVLQMHLAIAPVPPSKLVAGVPPKLDALMLGLLEKRPRDRIGHADDVAAVLAELGVTRDAGATRARAYLYRSSLLGRDAVVDELTALAREVAHGVGGFAVVVGESGIGKTYVAMEVARRLGRSLRKINGACLASDASSSATGRAPLHPLRELVARIADWCLEARPDEPQRLPGRCAAVLSTLEPRFARLADAEVETAVAFAAGARERLLAALTEAIETYAAHKPVLLLLDDLHWSDELTIAFLRGLSRDWLARHPFFVLATCRSEEMGTELRELVGYEHVHRFALGRLEDPAIHSLARDMLAVDDLPQPFTRFLAQQSEGNPFFAAEYLRTAVSEGLVRRVSHRGVELDRSLASPEADSPLALPPSLRALVLRRLAGLSREAQAVLHAAAALGREIHPELLGVMTGASELELMDRLTELTAGQVLEPIEGGTYRFLHHKLREIPYAELTPVERHELHRRAASAIERRYQGTLELPRFCASLAHHWGVVGDHAKTLSYLERAAQHAAETFAYGDAAELFQRALLVGARIAPAIDPLRRARLLHGLARAQFACGQLDEFERHTLAALDDFGQPMPRSERGWRALFARQLIVQALHLIGVKRPVDPERSDGLRDAAIASGLLSHRYFYLDDAVKMLSSALVSVNLADRVGVNPPHASALMGVLASMVRRRQLAARYFERARAAALTNRDQSERALALTLECVAHANFGRWSEAAHAAKRAAEGLHPSHDPVVYEIVQTTLGHVEYFTGQFESARRRYAVVLDSARARNHQQHVTWALFSAGRSLNALGRFTEALPLLSQACRDLEARPERQSEIICYGLLALASVRVGRREDARRFADETLARIGSSPPSGFPPLEGHAAIGDVYWELLAGAAREDERAALRERLARVRRATCNFALLFPVAWPVAWLLLGREASLAGRARLAGFCWRRSLRAAERFEMPRQRAEAHLALAALARPGSEERRAQARQAHALFALLDADYDAGRASALDSNH